MGTVHRADIQHFRKLIITASALCKKKKKRTHTVLKEKHLGSKGRGKEGENPTSEKKIKKK